MKAIATISLKKLFIAALISTLIVLTGIVIAVRADTHSVKRHLIASTSTAPTAAASPTPSTSGRYWIFNSTALDEVVSDASARSTLRNDTLYISGINKKALLAQATGLHIVAVEGFTSEASIATAISNKTIQSGTKAILYDNEPWSLTPAHESADPLSYYQKAATLVHAAGYLFIGTPVSRTNPNIAAQIAPYVDVLDIQAQSDQVTITEYDNHVLPNAQKARAANSKVIILSGLSTNPPAGIPTVNQLLNDAASVSTVVQGYWLNIPMPGPACPECHLPQPQLGISFLDSLGQK
jgi:hypothetical protein